MDDKRIEEELRSSSEQYEIKTTSKMILDAYSQESDAEKNEEPRKKKQLYLRLWPVYGGVAITATALTLFFTLGGSGVGPSSVPHPVIINPQADVRGGTRSQTAFQIFSGLNILGKVENVGFHQRQRADTNAEFSKVVDVFDDSYPTLAAMLEDSINLPNTIYKGKFRGEYATYDYSMEIAIAGERYFFYNDVSFEADEEEIEKTYRGEIVRDQESNYKVTIEKEENPTDRELEVEMQIQVGGGTSLLIEQEEEGGEREYSYTLKEGENTVREEKISFEAEDDEPGFYQMEIKSGEEEYHFSEIAKGDTATLCFEYSYGDLSGFASMQEEENQRTYRDEENGFKVVK